MVTHSNEPKENVGKTTGYRVSASSNEWPQTATQSPAPLSEIA